MNALRRCYTLHMTTENKYKEERFKTNKNFFKKFHEDVIATNRVGSDPRIGGNITMFISGINIDGKEYLIPLYNPETGEVEGTPYQVERNGEMKTLYKPDERALTRARKYIQSGKIDAYTNPDEAEKDRRIFYPQIVDHAN
mgnify:FL=1